MKSSWPTVAAPRRRRRRGPRYEFPAECQIDITQASLVHECHLSNLEIKLNELDEMLSTLQTSSECIELSIKQQKFETKHLQCSIQQQMQRHIEITRQSQKVLGKRWTKKVAERMDIIAATRKAKHPMANLMILQNKDVEELQIINMPPVDLDPVPPPPIDPNLLEDMDLDQDEEDSNCNSRNENGSNDGQVVLPYSRRRLPHQQTLTSSTSNVQSRFMSHMLRVQTSPNSVTAMHHSQSLLDYLQHSEAMAKHKTEHVEESPVKKGISVGASKRWFQKASDEDPVAGKQWHCNQAETNWCSKRCVDNKFCLPPVQQEQAVDLDLISSIAVAPPPSPKPLWGHIESRRIKQLQRRQARRQSVG